MRPLGTITKYYPFIDEESKSILDSLMDESSNYYDFVQRLCEVVLENKTPANLSYIAAVQAWWVRSAENMKQIQEKYSHVPSIRPWGYVHATTESDQVKYHHTVVRAIEEAIAHSVDGWMKTELLLLHAFYHWPWYGDVPSMLEPLEQAKELIETNPLLNCFEPLVCCFEAMVKRRENDVKGAILDYQRGLKLAEAHNDLLYRYMNLIGMANIIRPVNVQESLALFEELYKLAHDLETPYFLAEVLNDLAFTFEVAGEYDLAISSHLEGIETWGRRDTTFLILSRIYAVLDNGLLALEYADRAFETTGHLEFPNLYLRKAWALAVLNRLEEAEQELDMAHSLIMRTGSEDTLGSYYHISGVVEFKRKNFSAALDFFEQCYEISERYPGGLDQNVALLGLARTETALSSQSTESAMNITPGRWLSKLEKYASERDLPGIRMYAALLKSEFYQAHGEFKDAQTTLMDALNITDSLGVKTLRKKINDRILELNQLLREEAVSSKKRRE